MVESVAERESEERPTLKAAEAAFEAGDYRRVRELSAELERAEDPSVRAAAQDLARRVSVDPVQVAVLSGCLAFFGVIVYLYVL